MAALLPVDTANLRDTRCAVGRARLDYATAARIVADEQRDDDTSAAPLGQTLLLTHGHRAARVDLLLHGYTNSPRQFDSLAKLLYLQGDNVYVPRLPRHAERGGTAATLARITAEALRDKADSAVQVAYGLGDSVLVVGLSAGGTMAAWIAQSCAAVHRAVIIAPLLSLARVPPALDHIVIALSVRLPNVTRGEPAARGEADRELGWSSHAVGQILRLGLSVRQASLSVPPATQRIAVLVNAHDRTISNGAVLQLARRWSNAANVCIDELPDSLDLPHDIIDLRQTRRRPDVVYPIVVALTHGMSPPRSVGPVARRC